MLLLTFLLACGGETGFSVVQTGVGTLEGDARMVLTPATEVVWTDMRLDLTVAAEILVESTGEIPLTLYEARIINSGGGVFYLPDIWLEDTVVEPGESDTMLLTATLHLAEPAFGQLRVKCNDADAVEYLLDLAAYPEGWTGTTGTTGGTTATP